MKTIQFYKFSALALLILNVSLLGFFFFTSHHLPHSKHGFLNETIEILQLNEKQAEKFETLAKSHHQKMENVQQKQREWIKTYFNSAIDSVQKSLLRSIKEGEEQKIKITKQHFEEVKTILTPSQFSNYTSFEKKALDRLLLPKMDRKRPKE